MFAWRTYKLTIAFFLAVCFAGFGFAQDSASTVEDIVRSANDAGMQVIIIGEEPDESAGETAADPLRGSVLMKSQERAAAFREALRKRLEHGPDSISEVITVLNNKSPTGHYSNYFVMLAWTLALLFAAELIVGETFGKRLVGPWFIRLQIENPIGYTQKLPILLVRTALAVVGLMLVVLISYGLGLLFFGAADNRPESEREIVQVTVAYFYLTYFTARGVVFLWRMVLAPFLEKYRIPHFSNRDSKVLYYWMLNVATFAIITENFCGWMKEIGLSYGTHAIITSGLSNVVVLLNVAMVLFNRRAISLAILNGVPFREASVPARFFSWAWAPGVIVYFVVAWLEMTYRLVEVRPLGVPLISGFYMILLSILVVYALVGYVIERFFQRRRIIDAWNAQAAESEAEELSDFDEDGNQKSRGHFYHPHKMRTFEDLSRRLANILALVAGSWAIIEIWQIDVDMMMLPAIKRSYDIVAILFIGYVLFHSARIWIDQKIDEEGGGDIEVAPGDEGGTGGASRLATLLPLFRNFVLVVIVVAIALIALSELGINVAPLFAGAGVVGLAIGFGAQALVRDIFSGGFFLFDDAFRKGEYIDIGSVKGTVEKISVRSFQLRHHLGPLHTVPFGEIQHLTNFSRDWVMMKLKLRVTYDTDVEKVRKLVKKLGLELLEDEVVGAQFIQPLKSQGVVEMQDSAMIIRVKFMTKPGDQWVLRKRVYQEIRDLFAREGIKFAHREVTVRLAEGNADDLTPKQKEALGSAVLAMEDQDADDLAEGGNGSDER
ncbi:MAG: mechanosensitive ion channel family protein [Rhodobacteraceae bacterium]|nr:mechanosensitive ion channel family protein [Paracoccaceae bacterium]